VKEFFSLHWSVPATFLLWPVLAQFFLYFIEWLLNSPRNNLVRERKLFSSIYTALEDVVGEKCNAFADFGTALRNREVDPSPSNAFLSITNPDMRIEILISQFGRLVNDILKPDDDPAGWVSVVLCEIVDGNPSDYSAVYPPVDYPNSNLLDETVRGKTLFAKCAKRKKGVIILDIEKHLSNSKIPDKDYYPSSDPDKNKGSIAGIPVVHPQIGTVAYVLSLKSAKPFMIDEECLKYLKPAIRAFISRILLEHNLKIIQSHCHDHADR